MIKQSVGLPEKQIGSSELIAWSIDTKINTYKVYKTRKEIKGLKDKHTDKETAMPVQSWMTLPPLRTTPF